MLCGLQSFQVPVFTEVPSNHARVCCEVLRGLLSALRDPLCGLGPALRCVVRQQNVVLSVRELAPTCSCEVICSQLDIFFFVVSVEAAGVGGRWTLLLEKGTWSLSSGPEWLCILLMKASRRIGHGHLWEGRRRGAFWLPLPPLQKCEQTFCDIINKQFGVESFRWKVKRGRSTSRWDRRGSSGMQRHQRWQKETHVQWSMSETSHESVAFLAFFSVNGTSSCLPLPYFTAVWLSRASRVLERVCSSSPQRY